MGHLVREDSKIVTAAIRQEDVVPQSHGSVPAGAKHNPTQQAGNSDAIAVEPYPTTI
jgi:hypothetical protein